MKCKIDLRLLWHRIIFFWTGENELFYIGGEQILPPPLDKEEERRCIEALKTEEGGAFDKGGEMPGSGDNAENGSGDFENSRNEAREQAKKELIAHNLRLVVFLAKRFENTGVGVEDLISIGTIGLIKGINTYNPTKNIRLATYASRCIENEILMYLRRNSRRRMEVSIDEPLNVDWDGNELLLSDILGTEEDVISRGVETEAEIGTLHQALRILNDREREIIGLRYGINRPGGREMTQKEVAVKLGISQSYISRIEKKIMIRLRREMERYE